MVQRCWWGAPALGFCSVKVLRNKFTFSRKPWVCSTRNKHFCLFNASYDDKWGHLTRHVGSAILNFTIFLKNTKKMIYGQIYTKFALTMAMLKIISTHDTTKFLRISKDNWTLTEIFSGSQYILKTLRTLYGIHMGGGGGGRVIHSCSLFTGV